MPQNHGFRGHARRQHNKSAKPVLPDNEDSSPLIKQFRAYAQELDEKHDRYERIIKLGRDITIESKRIIFLLHTIDGRKNNHERVVTEAEERLNNLLANNFKSISAELIDQDLYQYRAAYSPGLQEFIEAYTFMEFLKYAKDKDTNAESEEVKEVHYMSDWESLEKKMQYTVIIPSVEEKPPPTEEVEVIQTVVESNTPVAGESKEVVFLINPTEYILGVADLTGELMRRCINSLGSGETDVCLSTCKVLQQFYAGYISLFVMRCRELSRKIVTMRQSVLKSEQVCYNVKVRGGEAAKWGAMYDNKMDDVDEGFF